MAGQSSRGRGGPGVGAARGGCELGWGGAGALAEDEDLGENGEIRLCEVDPGFQVLRMALSISLISPTSHAVRSALPLFQICVKGFSLCSITLFRSATLFCGPLLIQSCAVSISECSL